MFLEGFYLICVFGKNLLYLIVVFGKGIVIFNVLVLVLLNLKLLFFSDINLVDENLVFVYCILVMRVVFKLMGNFVMVYMVLVFFIMV